MELAKAVRNAEKLPKGSNHVKLLNAYGVLKDLEDQGHVLATIYGPNMNPPGKDVTDALNLV